MTRNTRLSVLILLASFIILHTFIALYFPKPGRASDLTTQNILAAINKERVARNLNALNENDLLDEAAQYKADDMQTRHYFAHVDPDGHYIWDKIVSLGYTPYVELGENLAINFYDTESLDDAWMQSPEHRANILNSGYKDQGMGVNLGNVQNGQYYSAIANTFGTLSTKTSAPQVAASTQTAPNTPTPAPAPKKITTPAPAPKKSTPPTSVPIPTPTPIIVVQPTSSPIIAVRGSNDIPTSTTPITTTTSTVPASQTATPTPLSSSVPYGALAGSSQPLNSTQANRYLALAFGIIILAFLGRDSWEYIKQKSAHLDKKINNLALLILALIVVGLMYWL